MELVYNKQTANHEISIWDTTELDGEQGSFRIIQFSGESVQGALDLQDPERIVFEYPRAIIHLMEYHHPAFEDVFMIGHGIGTISRHLASRRVQVAEIDDQVVELSRKYFGYDRNNVKLGDGRQLLNEVAPDSLDFVILDAFNGDGTPIHLLTESFFKEIHVKLNAEGAVLLNLIGRGGNDKLISAICTTLYTCFDYVKVFALRSGPAGSRQNVIMMAGHAPIGYQAKHMAGFVEIAVAQGYVIRDGD